MYELDIIVSKETRGAVRKRVSGNDIIRLKSLVNPIIEEICKESGMHDIVLFKWIISAPDDGRIIDSDKAYALINNLYVIKQLSSDKEKLKKEIS